MTGLRNGDRLGEAACLPLRVGHGEGDDAYRGVGEPGHHRGGCVPGEEHLADGTDHPWWSSCRAALEQRVETVLRGEVVAHRRRSLGDADDHKWTVKLSPSACELIPGKIDNADCVLKTSADLFAKLVDGSWKPGVVDFMSGKIKTNDLDLLLQLQKAFGF